ncbi:hypothetical protein M3Y96_00289400 [Aphelenchoides besseyi]|nr:hypothetical protein M3Y96_00289400 [Aphelenchoides besseyi]
MPVENTPSTLKPTTQLFCTKKLKFLTNPFQTESLLESALSSFSLLVSPFAFVALINGMSKDYAVVCDKVQQAALSVQLLKKLKFRKCVIYCSSDESALDLHKYLNSQEVSSVVSVLSAADSFAPKDYRSEDFINGGIPILVTTHQADDVGYSSSVDLILNQKLAADCEEYLRRQELWFKWKDRNSVCITFLPNKNDRERLFWFIWRRQLKASFPFTTFTGQILGH